MQLLLLPIIPLLLALISCNASDIEQTQPSQTFTEPFTSTKQPGKFLLETIDSFKPDNKRYSDISNLRDDCFHNKELGPLLGQKLFIGTIDNTAVGYFVYYIQDKNTAFIADVCVGTTYRGSGIGTKLFKQGISLIEARPEITKLVLEVNQNNKPALKLYQSAGFVRVISYFDPVEGGMDYMAKMLLRP